MFIALVASLAIVPSAGMVQKIERDTAVEALDVPDANNTCGGNSGSCGSGVSQLFQGQASKLQSLTIYRTTRSTARVTVDEVAKIFRILCVLRVVVQLTVVVASLVIVLALFARVMDRRICERRLL